MSIIYKDSKVKTIPVFPSWGSIGPILKTGTPLAADGTISNDGDAIGIVPYDVGKTDVLREVDVIVSGLLYLPEIEASYDTLTEECKAVLDNIAFVTEAGTIDAAGKVTAEEVEDAIADALADYTKTEDLPAVEYDGIILKSTTEGSTKKFLVTVDDTGALTATEITPPVEA